MLYHSIDLKCGANLDLRLNNMKNRGRMNGLSKTKIKNINYLDVILSDKSLTNAFINGITNMVRQHNINISLSEIT